MSVNDIFRIRLAEAMSERGMNAAQLSTRAGLNRRAVTDILDGRAQSPKLSTAVALAQAMGCDVGFLLGMPPRVEIAPALAELLSHYSQSDQERLAEALEKFPHPEG